MNPFLIALSGGAGALAEGGLAGFALHTGGVLLNSAIQEGTSPWTREARYHANNIAPNLVPDLASITRAWLAQKIGASEYQQLMAYHGADWNPGIPNANLTFTERAWNAIVDMSQSKHSIGDYLKWQRQNRLGPNQLDDMLFWYGFRDAGERGLFANQWESLASEKILQLYFVGKLTRQQAIDRFREIGIRQQEAELLLDPIHYGFTLPELIGLRLRRAIGDQEYDNGLKALGIRDQTSRAFVTELERTNPTITDIVHFSVREAWDNNIAQRYGYDQDFPHQLSWYAERQGINWAPVIPNPAGGNFPAISIPRLHWRSHWKLIPPEMAMRCLHRFRPDPANPGMSIVPGVPAFTSADVSNMLAVNDYAPGVRQWIEALSYGLLRLVDIRNIFLEGLRDRPWAIGKFQDRGLTQADATVVVDLLDRKKQANANPAHKAFVAGAQKQYVKDIVDAFKSGYLGRPLFKSKLEQMGWTPTESEQYAVMLEFQLENETVKAVTKAVKRDFFIGKSNAATARERLIQIGVSEYHADNYLIRWRAEFTDVKKVAATKWIIELFERGLITIQTAGNRLRNIGWSNEDTLLHLAASYQDILLGKTKVATAVESNRRKAATEIEKVIRENQKAIKENVSRLKAATPIWQMKLWLKNGVINEATFRNRLSAMEVSPDVVDAYVAEILGGPDDVELRGSDEVALRPVPTMDDFMGGIENGLGRALESVSEGATEEETNEKEERADS